VEALASQRIAPPRRVAFSFNRAIGPEHRGRED
jgi:hypothetical protein